MLNLPPNVQNMVLGRLSLQNQARVASVSNKHASAVQEYHARTKTSGRVVALRERMRDITDAYAQKLVTGMYRVLAAQRKYPQGMPITDPYLQDPTHVAGIEFPGTSFAITIYVPLNQGRRRVTKEMHLDFNFGKDFIAGRQRLQIVPDVHGDFYKLLRKKPFEVLRITPESTPTRSQIWLMKGVLSKALAMYRKNPVQTW